jgi:hypothetical protein
MGSPDNVLAVVPAAAAFPAFLIGSLPLATFLEDSLPRLSYGTCFSQSARTGVIINVAGDIAQPTY